MIYQNYKRHLFFAASAAILAAILFPMSETAVESQGAAETPRTSNGFAPPKIDRDASLVPASAARPDGMAGSGSFKWTTDFNSSEQARAIAVQPDGKIVAVGTTTIIGGDTNIPGGGSSYAGYDFAVFRYNTDGSLDTTFGGDGKVTASIGSDFGSREAANAVAIQPDGKIIAGGSLGEHFALVRFNPDGSPDNSFGSGGKVVTETGAGGVSEISVQPSGKIIAAGGGVELTVAHYNADGSLDTSFDTDGVLKVGSSGSAATAIAIQPDGSIVAGGHYVECVDNGDFEPQTCSNYFQLARYNANGSPDTSFGLPPNSSSGGAGAVAVQPDGRVIATNGPGLVRFSQNGSLDNSFGGDGWVTINVDAGAVVIQPDGKIVVSGTAVGTSFDFAVARLNSDGSPDTSFGEDGSVTIDDGAEEAILDAAVQADGRIIVAGYSGNDGYGFDAFDFALLRYNADGSLDSSFDGDGKLTTSTHDGTSAATAVVVGFGYSSFLVGYANNGVNDDFAVCSDGGGSGFAGRMITPIGNGDDRANAAVRVPNNKIVAVGYSDNGSNRDFALVRYHHYANVDTSFGTNGKVTTDFGGNDEATAIAVQWDGKVVVAGKTSSGGGAALVLARYNEDGTLDQTFGTGGRVIVTAIQNPTAIAIHPYGKIVIAGNAPHTVSPFGDNFAVARFHPDGSLDTSFDGDGIAVTRFDHTSQVNSLGLEHGKIVAAGFTRNSAGTASKFALARYNRDGSLDTSFDWDGKVTTQFAGHSEASAVQLLRNGKIVVAGSTVNASTGRDFALARYNENGSLDTTLDADGKRTTDFFGGDDDAFATAITYSDMIVAAGFARRDARSRFAQVLYYGDSPGSMPPPAPFDFDGDRRSDVSVFRPSTGKWYLQRSSHGFAAATWGDSTDKIAPADFTGDGWTDLSVFRGSSGTWHSFRLSNHDPMPAISWGQPGDLPVPADYDGDGRADIAVWRPSNGTWYILQSSDGWRFQQWGSQGDKPAPADFDGDGQIDLAVFRPSEGKWYVANFVTGAITVVGWGADGDIPFPGDYNGDGQADFAVYRPSNNTWYRLHSDDYSMHAQVWGTQDDIPAPGDYDGDGRMDLAVFRPTEGKWYVFTATNTIISSQFGQNGDIPTPSAFIY